MPPVPPDAQIWPLLQPDLSFRARPLSHTFLTCLPLSVALFAPMQLAELVVVFWLLPSVVGLLGVSPFRRCAPCAARIAPLSPQPRVTSGWRLDAAQEDLTLSSPSLDEAAEAEFAQDGSMDRVVAEEVRALLRILCMIDEKEGVEGLQRRAGLLLTDNSHLLCKGRVFEQTVSEELQRSSSPAHSERLERINSMVSGFLNAERKSRARTKINYILAGAMSGAMDSAVDLLSEADEIDVDLLTYLDQLVEKERARTRVLDRFVARNGSLQGGGDSEDLQLDLDLSPPDDEHSHNRRHPALDALLKVRQRLLAEVQLANRWPLKLLAKLLRIEDPAVRQDTLQSELTRIADMETFADFLSEGIDYFNTHGIDAKRVSIAGRDAERVEVPPHTAETMKDILRDVDALRLRLTTGSEEDDVSFSQMAT